MDSKITSNINSGVSGEVLKNTQKPTTKIDEKSSSSAQNLLEKKELFKKPDIAQNVAVSEEKNSAILEKLVNKLLDEIKSSSNLMLKNSGLTSTAKFLQVAPNLSKDLSELTKVLDKLSENLPELKELNAKLKEFLKPIADIKTTPLNTQIKNSGIMLEAAIKEALNEENIPASITKLANEMKRVSSDKLIKEFTKLAQNDNLDTKESFNQLKKILNEAKKSAQEIIQNPKNSDLKNIATTASKLENIVNFLNKLNSKNIPLTINQNISTSYTKDQNIAQQNIAMNNKNTALNINNTNMPNATNISNTVDKTINLNQSNDSIKDELLDTKNKANVSQEIKEKDTNIKDIKKSPLESLLKSEQTTTNQQQNKSLKETSITKEVAKQLTNNINSIVTSLKTEISNINLPKNEQISSLQKEINNIISDIQNSITKITSNEQSMASNFSQSIATDNSISKSENFTLQDKLSAAANKLNQISKLTSREFSDAKITLGETKSLLKNFDVAQNDLEKITPKNRSEAMANLDGDIKKTLLNINKTTENSSLPNANQANNITNKLIAQIDIHQLASFASGSLQTYMPYVWEGVEGGNIAFKQGKKNKYYCKIDLNFKDHGSLNVFLALSKDKFLEISIAAQSEYFKNLILENSRDLKTAIIGTGLNITNFSLKTMSKNTLLNAYEFSDMFDLGFDKRA